MISEELPSWIAMKVPAEICPLVIGRPLDQLTEILASAATRPVLAAMEPWNCFMSEKVSRLLHAHYGPTAYANLWRRRD